MTRDQDHPATSEIQTSIDPDALIIYSIRGQANRIVGAATLVPGFYNQPLHQRDVPHSLLEILNMHSAAQKSESTHNVVMTGANLSKVLYSETLTKEEKKLRTRLKNGSHKLRESLGLPRRTNS